jgi:hypothetical protein
MSEMVSFTCKGGRATLWDETCEYLDRYEISLMIPQGELRRGKREQ